MMSNKRKNIPKKMRFEVFKRDDFTCQYCGRKAPEIILHIDHIVPVFEGGKNSVTNLVTSCDECNLGKGKTLLSDKTVAEKSVDEVRRRKNRLEQIEMIAKWKRDIEDSFDKEVDIIEGVMFEDYDSSLTSAGRRIVKGCVKRFGFELALECAYISRDQYDDPNLIINMFGGICYNKFHKK